MNDLVGFAKRVKSELENACREPFWTEVDAQRYMTGVGTRREQFTQLASKWITTIALPRMEIVASHFTNATFGRQSGEGQCRLQFGYCERFPASAEVAISVEHDLRYEKLLVAYDAFMVPQDWSLPSKTWHQDRCAL